MIDLLAGLAAEHGATVVVATHDATLASRAPRRLRCATAASSARPCSRLSA